MKPMMSLKKMLVLSAAKELNKRAAKVAPVKAAKPPPLQKAEVPREMPMMKAPTVAAVGRAAQPNPNKIKQVRAGKSPGIAKMQQGLRVKPSKW